MKKKRIRVPVINRELIKLWKIMRISVFFLLLLVCQTFAAATYSQENHLTLKMENARIIDVLDRIEDESQFLFLFNQKLVDVERKVNVDVKKENIEKILSEIFKDTNVSYVVKNRQIILTTANPESINVKQKKTVSGKVTDNTGQSIPGVSIVIKGTSTGTITNADGNYSLPNIPESAVLQFSFVGMKEQEIVVGKKTNINVILVEESVGIDEVVAIGYGTQKKANLTGAVSMVTSERLENRPIVSAGQGLQGVIPGLNITFDSGDPTDAADFNIRGFESINGGSPLILVDGVPMDPDQINPGDIASVNVLKDAAAAAIYGARAAFGVILIETIKGKKSEKIKVTLSSEQTLAKPIFLMDPVTNPYDFVTNWNEAYMRTNGQVYYDDDYITKTAAWVEDPTEENAWGVVNGTLRFYGNNDYMNKTITDYAPQQKYDLSINGATEKSSYYVSFGMLNKDGYIKMSSKNEKYKRYNVLMKVDSKINDWLSLDEKFVLNSVNSNKPHFYNWDVNINTAARVSPVQAIEFPDLDYYVAEGDHDEYSQYIGMYFGSTNWIPYLKNGGRTTFNTNDIWLTQGVTITPLKGLKIRSDFSYNFYHKDYQDVASKVEVVSTNLLDDDMIDYGYSGTDYIKNTSNYNQYYVFNAYAEYTLDKYQDHYFKVMGGFNQEWGRYTYVSAKAYTLLTSSVTDLNATTGSQETGGSKSEVAIRGAFYRLNYRFKDRYLFETNGRYDGTSRFPSDSRFGFFPSVSLGWRISEEPFMENLSGWMDNLKIRASYGKLGNQTILDSSGDQSYYPYISTMGSGMSSYIMSSGMTAAVTPGGLVSSDLTWETVATKNFGIDFTGLRNRLDVSFDYYIRDTKNMLMDVTYPDILGTDAPQSNAADLRTKGWELGVSWRDKIDRNWHYGVNVSLSDHKSEITKYENPTGALGEYYEGQDIGEIWGYETEGIFQYDDDVAEHADQTDIGSNWQAGDIMYKDLDGDDAITSGSYTLDDPGDRKIIGNSTSRYSFGVNPYISYKNWSLNIFFQGVLKRDFLPQNGSWKAFYPYNSGYIDKYYISECWSETNRDAYFAAPSIQSVDQKNIQNQSRYIQNAAYVRLKNLTLNYNLPGNFVKRMGISKAQVYFAGMNMWEYSKMHKPLDPEQRDNLTQDYYFQRLYTVGVKVSF